MKEIYLGGEMQMFALTIDLFVCLSLSPPRRTPGAGRPVAATCTVGGARLALSALSTQPQEIFLENYSLSITQISTPAITRLDLRSLLASKLATSVR